MKEQEKKIIGLQEIKRLELDILKYLKDICDTNSLRYYLAYGTLLGAVRHQGFIPWDDDIDIMMPREDYEKLVDIMRVDRHSYYSLVSKDTHPEFTAPLPKIIDIRTELIQNYAFIERVPLGVYIDIFVLDGAGDSIEEARKIADEAWRLKKKWQRADTKMFPPRVSKFLSILRWFRNLPYKIKGIDYYLQKMKEHNSRYAFDKSKFIAVLDFMTYEIGGSIWDNIWDSEYFGEGDQLLFEGEEFNVPKEYHKVLKGIYGAYMELPPERERKSRHDYEVFWK